MTPATVPIIRDSPDPEDSDCEASPPKKPDESHGENGSVKKRKNASKCGPNLGNTKGVKKQIRSGPGPASRTGKPKATQPEKNTRIRSGPGPASRTGKPKATKSDLEKSAQPIGTNGAPESSPARSNIESHALTDDEESSKSSDESENNSAINKSSRAVENQTKSKQTPPKKSTARRKQNKSGQVTKKRVKRGAHDLQEIKRLQRTTQNQIPQRSFTRVVRQIAEDISFGKKDHPIRFQPSALAALQEAAESYLVLVFERAYLATIHAKRVTLMPKDIQLQDRIVKMSHVAGIRFI